MRTILTAAAALLPTVAFAQTLEAELRSPLTDVPGARYGTAVALTPSGDAALIGSLADSAYAFRRDGDMWRLDAAFPVSTAGVPIFSNGVALGGHPGDETALLGTPGDDDAGPDAGAALVFRYNPGNGWYQEVKLLRPSSVADTTHFGQGVALSAAGDVAAVGALERDGNVVAVYRREPSEEWAEDGQLRPPRAVAPSLTSPAFGLSPSGRWLAAFASRDSVDANGQPFALPPEVWLYRREVSGWVLAETLREDWPGELLSLALLDDPDQASECRVFVGIWEPGFHFGEVWIFRNDTPELPWSLEHRITDVFGGRLSYKVQFIAVAGEPAAALMLVDSAENADIYRDDEVGAWYGTGGSPITPPRSPSLPLPLPLTPSVWPGRPRAGGPSSTTFATSSRQSPSPTRPKRRSSKHLLTPSASGSRSPCALRHRVRSA